MVILYITHISYNLTAGLSYSIPAQTAAQSDYDQVLWLNTIKNKGSAWVNNPVLQYWDKPLKLKLFPQPFHQPDLVVFESFYQIKDVVFAKELRRNSIPYIIVPRGALTDGAQHKKRIKKVIGNALVFKKFSKKAAAIHFLTEQERNASSKRWNSHSFVLPNGTYPRKATKKFCVDDKVKKLSFIGRLDAYHKGLDLLLSACKAELELLTKNHIEIHIYGNDNRKNIKYLNTLIIENNLTRLVFLHKGVFNQEKENVLLKSDVFVLTSRFEGHPTGLIEALAYGIPCLITEGTNMGKEVREYQAGWVSDATVEGIRSSLRRMFEEDLVLMGKRAKAISHNYEWDTIAEKTHAVYQTICREGR